MSSAAETCGAWVKAAMVRAPVAVATAMPITRRMRRVDEGTVCDIDGRLMVTPLTLETSLNLEQSR